MGSQKGPRAEGKVVDRNFKGTLGPEDEVGRKVVDDRPGSRTDTRAQALRRRPRPGRGVASSPCPRPSSRSTRSGGPRPDGLRVVECHDPRTDAANDPIALSRPDQAGLPALSPVERRGSRSRWAFRSQAIDRVAPVAECQVEPAWKFLEKPRHCFPFTDTGVRRS